MNLRAIHEVTGDIVTSGAQVTTFRGETMIYRGSTRPRTAGRSGKILLGDREYYDGVASLFVVDLADEGQYLGTNSVVAEAFAAARNTESTS